MDTSGYGGRTVQKSAAVMSNDPKEPVVELAISGQVDRFATITPRMLSLRGTAGETLRGVVSIVPEDKYPFRIVGTTAQGGKLKVKVDEVKQGDKKAYTLQVENLATEVGSFNDTVRLKTDSPLQPEVDVRVFVYLRPQPPGPKKTN